VIVPRELAGLLPDPAAAELTQLRPLALKGLSKPVTASAMRLRALELAA